MRKRRHILRNIIPIILVIFFLLIVWGIFSSYHILAVTKYEVNSEKVEDDIKVVMISDLHNHSFGSGNCALVKKIRKLNPDIILLSGDILDSSASDAHVPLELILQLAEISPVYYSLGNQEEEYIKRMEGRAVL